MCLSENDASWATLRSQSDPCHQGEAEVSILNFETTWSEFQKPRKTATTFQSHSQAVACVSTPRMYPTAGTF